MRTTTTLSALRLLAALLAAAAPLPLAAQEQAADRRSDTAPPAAAAAADDAEAQAAARRERLRRLRYGNVAELELDGKTLRITWPDLMTDSDDYRAFAGLEAGQVAAWTGGRAIKLLADASPAFNGVVVPGGNASPDYPGVYSLWPKRTADGWSLVFNGDADIWGSQRNPAADVVEAPLEHSRADQPTEKLTIEFLDVEPGAVLRIAWGDHQFLATFDTAEP